MSYSISVDVSAILDGENIDAADVTTPINNLKTAVQDLGNGVSTPEQFQLKEIATPANPASGSQKVYVNSTDHKLHRLTSAGTDTAIEPGLASQACNARLTLTSGLAVTNADVTAATSVYVTPFKGNHLALYNGSLWVDYTFTEITLALAGATADKNYDVFAYDNGSGVVTAESVIWTNDTTRATALALQDGVYCKTGTLTKRYIGTYRTTSTIGQCEDSVTKRYVWNYYNRVERDFYLIESTNSWTYATATWRAWNASTSNRFSFVRGVNEEPVSVNFIPNASEAGAVAASVGIGLDWASGAPGVTSINGQLIATTATSMPAIYIGKPSEGFHYLQFVEFASGATVTFYGDNGGTQMQSGATGRMAA